MRFCAFFGAKNLASDLWGVARVRCFTSPPSSKWSKCWGKVMCYGVREGKARMTQWIGCSPHVVLFKSTLRNELRKNGQHVRISVGKSFYTNFCCKYERGCPSKHLKGRFRGACPSVHIKACLYLVDHVLHGCRPYWGPMCTGVQRLT